MLYNQVMKLSFLPNHLWLVSLLVVCSYAEETKLTLPEAISEAVENNFTLATSQIEATFPDTQLQIAQSDFRWKMYPTFSVETDSRYETSSTVGARVEKSFSPGTLFQVRAEWIAREENENGERVDLRVEQPLFKRFGKSVTYQAIDDAAFNLQSAQLRLHRETETLILRVVTSYTMALNQAERLKQEITALIRASDLVRLVEVKQRQGRATGVEVLEMKMLHRQAELRFRQAEERLLQSRADLAELMGRVSEQLPQLESVELNKRALPNTAEAERIARDNRVEREQALASYANARRQLKLEERERYPDVRIIGNYRPVTDSGEEEWFAGLSAGRNLDSRTLKLQIEQEQNQVQAALMHLAAVEVQISREVHQSRSRLTTLEQEMGIAEAQLDLSRERLRLARGLYPSGRTSSVQLRDAEEEWVESQTNKTDVYLQQVRARYQFWYVLGLLLGDSE